MKKYQIKLIVALLVVILLAVIVFQNREPVATRLLFITVSMPRAVLLFLATAVGYVLGAVTALALAKHRSPRK